MFAGILPQRASKNTGWLRIHQGDLEVEILSKRMEFVAASSGLRCSGARDQPPPQGNQKKGLSPMAQVGPAPGEAVLRAHALTLSNDAPLSELIQLRGQLLINSATPR